MAASPVPGPRRIPDPAAPGPGRPPVLVLANSRPWRGLLRDVLPGYRVVTMPSPAAVRRALALDAYALVIVSNLGVGPRQAVEAVPPDHDYPVLFLTGVMDPALAAECRRRAIQVQDLPVPLADLRRLLALALDDPALLGPGPA